MPESLRDVIEDIQRKLRTNAYQNEEHVRLSLVARVVQALGWDIWNPGEVFTEFQVVPDEDRTKVDMALFAVTTYPAVFIEIKAVGKMEANLPSIEGQVRDYTRNITTPFAIITDGKLWRFYYVKGDGSFGQKLFDSVDLSKIDTFYAEKVFESYLSKVEVRSGNAENEAKKKLNVTQIYLEMANCFPSAEARTRREPYPTLPDAIISEMSSKGYSFTTQEAVKFIRSREEKSATTPPAPQPPRTNNTVESNVLQEPLPLRQGLRLEERMRRELGLTETHNHVPGVQNYQGRTPVSFQFKNSEYPVNSWINLLIQVAIIIQRDHPNDFHKCESLGSGTYKYFSKDINEVQKPQKVGTTGYYVHTYIGSEEIVRRARKLIAQFGHNPNDLEIRIAGSDNN